MSRHSRPGRTDAQSEKSSIRKKLCGFGQQFLCQMAQKYRSEYPTWPSSDARRSSLDGKFVVTVLAKLAARNIG